MNLENFNQRLSERRGALQLTQKALAERAEISATNLTEYLKGRKTPNLATLQKLAKVLQCNVSWLTGETNDTIGPIANTERVRVEHTEVMVPVLGTIHAGPFQLADENLVRDYVSGELSDRGNFALKVRGDSMSPAYIDGETIFCKRSEFQLDPMMDEEREPHPRVPFERAVRFEGKDCVCLFEGESVLRRIHVEKGKGLRYTVLMEPLNPAYDKKEVRRSHSFNIQAVVYKSVRPR